MKSANTLDLTLIDGFSQMAADPDFHQHERLVTKLEDVEQAFAQAYYFVKGEAPKWSKTFGYAEALEDIKDACALLRAAAKP